MALTQPASKPAGIEFEDLYSKFGPKGSAFQCFFEVLSFSTIDSIQNCQNPLSRSALEQWQSGDRAMFWFSQLIQIALDENPAQTYLTMEEIWNKFSAIFRPKFKSAEQMFRRKVEFGIAMQLDMLKSHLARNFHRERAALSQICHGPFSEAEMEYLLRFHPKIVELGSGNGYFATEFARRGGDIIAIDSGRYFGSEGQYMRWHEELRKAGRWIQGDENALSDFAKQRSLLISWPEPRAEFPFRALQIYGESGGRHFLFKLGAFHGSQVSLTSAGRTDVTEGTYDYCRQFYRELSEHWVEAGEKQRPIFVPQTRSDNLWAFRRPRLARARKR